MSHMPHFYLRGLRKIDKEFLKMIDVRDACYEAGVDVPEAVYKYFGRKDIDYPIDDLKTMKFGTKIVAIDGSSGEIIESGTDKKLLIDVKRHDMQRFIALNLKALPTELETLEIEITW